MVTKWTLSCMHKSLKTKWRVFGKPGYWWRLLQNATLVTQRKDVQYNCIMENIFGIRFHITEFSKLDNILFHRDIHPRLEKLKLASRPHQQRCQSHFESELGLVCSFIQKYRVRQFVRRSITFFCSVGIYGSPVAFRFFVGVWTSLMFHRVNLFLKRCLVIRSLKQIERWHLKYCIYCFL